MNQSRLLRSVLVLAFVIAPIASPQMLPAQQKHGDVNGDGVVSALDAQAILTAVVGLPLPAGFVAVNGDANCDAGAQPTALDAQIVLSFVIGLNVSQYCVNQTFGPAGVRVKILAGTVAVPDTALLINRGIWLRATLKDAQGFDIQRPIAWSNGASDIVSLDTIRSDSAFVKAKTLAGSATITAAADGATGPILIGVVTSFAGIVIQPQRSDTLRQLNAPYSFTARIRDSVGVVSTTQTAFWTITDANIATVSPATASSSATVTTATSGTTYLRATSSASPTVKDSVRLVVALTPVNSCTGVGGTLHPNATYTTPQTWLATTNPHYVTGSLTFNGTSGLTIGPGTLLCLSSGVQLTFNAGSRLIARGKPDSLITLTGSTPTTQWSGIQLGNAFSYAGSAPLDTSWITNALLERGGSSQGITGREQHALIMDSVRLRQFVSAGVRIFGPGGRLSRSTVDTLTSAGTAVTIGRGILEFTTIRSVSATYAVSLTDTATVRNVTIIGGTTALSQTCCSDSARVNDVTISGTSGVAVDLQQYALRGSSANVQISSGTGGAFRGSIANLGVLFPDSLKQQTLKNNGKDTLFITGGTLRAATLVARPDLPWIVESFAYIDTLAQLAPRPGARFLFSFGGFNFQSGGTLNAVGEVNKFIRFGPVGGSTFYGLRFDTPGQGANPATAPTAISTLTYVRVDSAAGQGVNTSNICCFSAAINGGVRHRLLLDSVIVHKAWNTAVALSGNGSYLRRSLIDTTGNVGTNYTTSQPAVALGDTTSMENSLVRRSGYTGLYVPGLDVVLTNVRVVASQNVALQADVDIISATSANVKVDSANAYPFYGRIENFGILANTAPLQTANLLGNVDNVAIITGGNLVNRTVAVIPALRWQVNTQTYIDTLAQLVPQPGSDITFQNGGLIFLAGGTLNAVGTTNNFIRFRPLGTSAFYGLRFDTPGQGPNPATAPIAISTLTYVRVDSATGQGVNTTNMCCYSAAVNGGNRHRLLMDSVIVHKAFNTAVAISGEGSYLKRSLIDTTGNVGTGYTTSQPAVVAGDTTTVENTLVRRSGYTGIYAPRYRTLFTNVRVVASLNVALQVDGFALDPASSNVKADSANAYPFYGRIENFGIIANTAGLQTSNLLGNTDNVAVIVGGTLTNQTVAVIPALRWQVTQSPAVDTQAVLQPQPGALITFTDGNLRFQHGGTLNAIGANNNFIVFGPANSSFNWSGLEFDEPGDGGQPAPNRPYATSTMTYVRVDSASGTSTNNYTVCCYSAAIAGAIRHRLLLDSVIVHKAHNNAIWLNARGSYIKRSLIDTTGNFGSGYLTNQPAVALGDTISVENTLIRRSGQVGLYAPRFRTLLTNVRVVASVNVGLQLDQNVMDPASTNVKADSANAYPFYGRIDNFGVIANTGALQTTNLIGSGNTDNVAVIVAGTLTNRTVDVIPQLRWQVTQSPNVDTGAVLVAQPGADITFTDGNLRFSRGGTLNAVGTIANFIRFRPATPGSNWAGLQFDEPGAGGGGPGSWPYAISTMTYVRVDSASGTSINDYRYCCYSAAIAGALRHRLLLDSVIVHKAHNNALWLNASGGYVRRSLIDTTGNVGSNYQTGQPAVVLGDSMEISRSVVRRSGGDGVHLPGFSQTLDSVRVVNSRLDGWILDHTGTTYSGNNGVDAIVADSSGGNGFSIRNSNITLQKCVATRGLTATSHGVATSNTYSGVVVQNCDFLNNGGNGVNNFTTNVTYVILADNNYWGDPGGPDTGDGRSANVTANLFCTGGTCTDPSFLPMQQPPSTPAIPPRSFDSRSILRSRRRRLRARAESRKPRAAT